MNPLYPLGLRIAGRRVLVVGGGSVAARRVPRLLDAGADVVLVSPAVSPSLEALADGGRLRWERRGFVPSDVAGAWLVLAATDEPSLNAEIATIAEEGRVFCVRSDDALGGSAWTPAVARHERVTVAVFGGRDPRRAAALRDAVHDKLIDGSLDAPPVREPEPSRPGVFRPAGGRAVPGVALVGAGPGDPELITVRGRRLLGRADVVVADRLVPPLLLDELRPDVELVDAAKLPRGRQMAQEAINELVVERALAGRFVVRLKGGDPFLFGRGGEELAACLAAGLPVEVVPGVTSAVAVPEVVGIPVTHRGVAQEVVIVSGHLAPDDPGSLVDWAALAKLRGTLVLMMATEHLAAIATAIVAGGRDPDTPAVAVIDGTTDQQRVVAGKLGTIADSGVGPPAVIVVGEVTGMLAYHEADDGQDPR